jgi:SAM-dependent methyltransferase
VDHRDIDALADQYDAILDKYHIMPSVRTEKLEAEKIAQRFPANTFDLCFARNCLDHAYDPEDAILQMITVTKPGCYVLLEHFRNEAEENGYEGLHQWNFDTAP